MAHILITGATGSLGRRVAHRALAAGHTVIGTHVRELGTAVLGRPGDAADAGGRAPRAAIEWVRLDIRDRRATRDVVDAAAPDFVVHAAAGRDRNDWAATADGAANVAVACAQAVAGPVRLVHVSSNAIFSGRAGREYTERDEPDPIYPYGAAKAAAETAVRAIMPSAVVVRTSLILGDGNGAHELLTHDLVAGRADGALFTDEIRKPVHVDDLADALLELGAKNAKNAKNAEDAEAAEAARGAETAKDAGKAGKPGEYAGVLNVAGPDAISRYDLGLLVAHRDGLDAGRLRAATSSGRPGDLRLDIGLAAVTLRTRLRGAREFMAR
ncbi:sugar nucleotide-binding protein [Dactylosporangium salmoneum]|uniref:Sugar nucleotide-binding protein n=1 Tax=Dactylosporangium salmoneum TaxID=53361 RepID=A0ABN3HQM1_9ACTN